MKRMNMLISTLAASLLISAAPALGHETSTGQSEQMSQQKDECLLMARNCVTRFPTLGAKSQALQDEIAKGTAVYTPEELQVLKQKLNATIGEISDSLNLDGGA